MCNECVVKYTASTCELSEVDTGGEHYYVCSLCYYVLFIKVIQDAY